MVLHQRGIEVTLYEAAHPMYPVGSNGASHVFAAGELEAVPAEYKRVAGLLRDPTQRTCIPPSTSNTSPVQ